MKKKNNYGFTLVEIVIVFVIVGILSITAFIIVGNVLERRIDVAAKKVEADIRYAQSLAFSRADNAGISFSVASNSYIVFENNDITDPAEHPLTKKDFIVDFDSLTQYKGVQITQVSFPPSATTTVLFDFLGNPFNEQGIALSGNGEILLNGGKRKIIVYKGSGTTEIK
ncbi:prepilin-type N-terminal cleavage/methylation domain-containing protein [Chlamydiota bacterium]